MFAASCRSNRLQMAAKTAEPIRSYKLFWEVFYSLMSWFDDDVLFLFCLLGQVEVDKQVFRGTGPNKKVAKASAALAALNSLFSGSKSASIKKKRPNPPVSRSPTDKLLSFTSRSVKDSAVRVKTPSVSLQPKRPVASVLTIPTLAARPPRVPVIPRAPYISSPPTHSYIPPGESRLFKSHAYLCSVTPGVGLHLNLNDSSSQRVSILFRSKVRKVCMI